MEKVIAWIWIMKTWEDSFFDILWVAESKKWIGRWTKHWPVSSSIYNLHSTAFFLGVEVLIVDLDAFRNKLQLVNYHICCLVFYISIAHIYIVMRCENLKTPESAKVQMQKMPSFMCGGVCTDCTFSMLPLSSASCSVILIIHIMCFHIIYINILFVAILVSIFCIYHLEIVVASAMKRGFISIAKHFHL